MFKIGERVWTVGTETNRQWIICPDCLGQKYVTVILGDGSQVSVNCGCGHGFDGPRGGYEEYVTRLESKQRTVTGVEIRLEHGVEKVEYRLDGCYGGHEDRVFATKEEADARLGELIKKDEEESQRRLMWKKQDNRKTWAWNAHYHRDCLKRANRDIEYHSRMLAVAKTHIKAEKIAAAPAADEKREGL